MLRFIFICTMIISCSHAKKSDESPQKVGTESDESPKQTYLKSQDLPTEKPNGLPPKIEGISINDIAGILQNPEYGPCTSCHTQNNWPNVTALLSDSNEPFKPSESDIRHNIRNRKDLVNYIYECVNPISLVHCAGPNPRPNSDLSDFKMPGKFGFNAVSKQDLAILEAWTKSYTSNDHLTPKPTSTFESPH